MKLLIFLFFVSCACAFSNEYYDYVCHGKTVEAIDLLEKLSDQQLHAHAYFSNYLSTAGGCGNLEVISYLLDRGLEVDFSPDGTHTALIEAVESEKIETVKFLLSKGADINAPKGFWRRTPLATACYDGTNMEIIDLLLNNGANIDAGEEPPLELALAMGNQILVKYLIEKGADISNGKRLSEMAYKNHLFSLEHTEGTSFTYELLSLMDRFPEKNYLLLPLLTNEANYYNDLTLTRCGRAMIVAKEYGMELYTERFLPVHLEETS